MIFQVQRINLIYHIHVYINFKDKICTIEVYFHVPKILSQQEREREREREINSKDKTNTTLQVCYSFETHITNKNPFFN